MALIGNFVLLKVVDQVGRGGPADFTDRVTMFATRLDRVGTLQLHKVVPNE